MKIIFRSPLRYYIFFLCVELKDTMTYANTSFVVMNGIQHHRMSGTPITNNRDSRSLVYPDEQKGEAAVQLKRFDEQNDEDIFQEFTRFTKSSRPVDYGDNHPYEVLRRRRMREASGSSLSSEDEEEFQSFLDRHLSPWDPNSEYKPIRIHMDTNYLGLVKKDYGPEVDYLENELLPKVKTFWEKALRLYPIPNNLVITSKDCPISNIRQNTTGIPDTDLIILVAANIDTICKTATEPSVAATSCQYDIYDRPTVGRATICLQDLDITKTHQTNALFKLLVHGFAHIFGFSHRDYQFYYNPRTGRPRTTRPFKKSTVKCVDGQTQLRVVPSADTIQSGFTSRGLRYFEIVTPTVRAIARNQFNCQRMTGARLENQPTNNGNCFGSHWEARLFAFDIVTAITLPTEQVLSQLTLALFEDTGWYKVDYSVGKMSSFGHARGCDFVYEDCIQDGQIPEWSEGFFCNTLLSEQKLQCDPNHAHITFCDLVDYDTLGFAVAPNRKQRYFPGKPSYGGLMHTADYCPLTSRVQFDCSVDDDGSGMSKNEIEFFGPESRCVETNLQRPLCLKFECNQQRRRLVLFVKRGDQFISITCENDGDTMTIPGLAGGTIQCPAFDMICPHLSCPHNCRGRGICEYAFDTPVCKCCDSKDTSEDCRYSPPGCDFTEDEGKFYCGETPYDASRCRNSDECPGGMDSECSENQKCFAITECDDSDGNKYCGKTGAEAAACNGAKCHTDNDCPYGSSCFGVETCDQGRDNGYCGSSSFAASVCREGSQCSFTSDCPSGQECFEVECRGDGTHFCGNSPDAASQCLPGGECNSNSDCRGGQTCQEVTKCREPPTPAPTPMPIAQPDTKFCGQNGSDAAACVPGASCRTNSDCPPSSYCYDVQVCNPGGANNGNMFCGTSSLDAATCEEGSECVESYNCPLGQACFEVQCKGGGNYFCGFSPFGASQCLVGSECNSSADCSGGQTCQEVVKCTYPPTSPPTFMPTTMPTVNPYCGENGSAAAACEAGASCRVNDDCPSGASCFAVETCDEDEGGIDNGYCGESSSAAAACQEGSKCVSASDCPSNQECFEVQCKGEGTFFCGLSTFGASQCLAGNECVTNSDCEGLQTCREVLNCRRPPTLPPTSMPSPKPRTTLNIKYLLCLEHGLLTSTLKLTRKSREEIERILTEKFSDDIIDIDEKWGVDESHLRVENVVSEQVVTLPGNFECTCEVGDSKSVCSAVDSVVTVSYWEELDSDVIRYILLHFQNFVVDDFKYPAKYWGFTPFEATSELKLSGISAQDIVDPSWTKNFEKRMKNSLNSDPKTMNIAGFQTLIVKLSSVRALSNERSLRLATLQRSIEEEEHSISLTVAGQYEAPPKINNFRKIIGGSLDRLLAPDKIEETFDGSLGTDVEVETAIEEGNDDVDDFNGEINDDDSRAGLGDRNANDDATIPRRKNSSNIGVIVGIMFGLLALLISIILTIAWSRRRRDKELLEHNQHAFDRAPDYGDYYGQDAAQSNYEMSIHDATHQSEFDENNTYNDSYKTSVVTDPTYMGGKYPDRHKFNEDDHDGRYSQSYDDRTRGNSSARSRSIHTRSYHGYEEDEFDMDDVGTFTGHTIKSAGNDDVSCLMSVKGVEDTWNDIPTAQQSSAPTTNETLPPDINSGNKKSLNVESYISAPTIMFDSSKKERIPFNRSASLRSYKSEGSYGGNRSVGSGGRTHTSAPTVMPETNRHDQTASQQHPQSNENNPVRQDNGEMYMVDEEDDMESYVSGESSSFRDTQRTVKKYEDNLVSSLLPVDEASAHIETEYDSPSKIVAPLLSGGTKQTSSPLALSHRRASLPMDLLSDMGNDRTITKSYASSSDLPKQTYESQSLEERIVSSSSVGRDVMDNNSLNLLAQSHRRASLPVDLLPGMGDGGIVTKPSSTAYPSNLSEQNYKDQTQEGGIVSSSSVGREAINNNSPNLLAQSHSRASLPVDLLSDMGDGRIVTRPFGSAASSLDLQLHDYGGQSSEGRIVSSSVVRENPSNLLAQSHSRASLPVDLLPGMGDGRIVTRPPSSAASSSDLSAQNHLGQPSEGRIVGRENPSNLLAQSHKRTSLPVDLLPGMGDGRIATRPPSSAASSSDLLEHNHEGRLSDGRIVSSSSADQDEFITTNLQGDLVSNDKASGTIASAALDASGKSERRLTKKDSGVSDSSSSKRGSMSSLFQGTVLTID